MSKLGIKPLGDRVVVKADEVEEKTAGGLILAGESKEKPSTGTVVAVGPGKTTDDGKTLPMPVAEGDKLLYSKYGGTEVKHGGEEYLILRADDIYAIV